MRRRRAFLALLTTAALIGLYHLAVLVLTSAKLLGFASVFDFWRGPIARSAILIGTIPADVYESSRPGFPVMIVHGVNESGKDSPELRPVAEALAGSGFRVVVPEFSRMKRQNVTAADIDDVATAFRSLEADGGIVCASYGCGPVLIAASRPDIRDRVRFVLAFGGYFDLTATLRSIVTGPPTSFAYSKWIYMAANADLITDDRDREMFLAIAEERQQRSPGEWLLTANSLGDGARAMLNLFESGTPAELDARLPATPGLRARIEALSPSLYFDGLRGRLILVHMDRDPSIPSTESRRMAEEAKRRGVPYNLTILNMYGHTRLVWPDAGVRNLIFFYLPETWKFIRVVRQVLSYA